MLVLLSLITDEYVFMLIKKQKDSKTCFSRSSSRSIINYRQQKPNEYINYQYVRHNINNNPILFH